MVTAMTTTASGRAGERQLERARHQTALARLKVAIMLANAVSVAGWPRRSIAGLRKSLVGMCGTQNANFIRAASVLTLAELQDWTKVQLEAWFEADGRVVVGLDASDVPLVLEVRRNRTVGAMRGTLGGVYVLTVAFLLAAEGHRLRQCPDPKCRRFFLKDGKQDYCSTRCRGRVYMRQYRLQ